LGITGVTGGKTSFVVEGFSSAFSSLVTLSLFPEELCPSCFASFTTSEVGGVDETYVSVDRLGEAAEVLPALELATVVPFNEGEEGAVRARDWPFALVGWLVEVSTGVEAAVAF
jgi:hypothetical protein